jgi:hypothetical protein
MIDSNRGRGGLGFLASHARVLLCIARDPGVRLRDIAARTGATGRTAYGITDLTGAGHVVKHKDSCRNRYQIQAHLPLSETGSRERTISEVLALLGNTGGRDAPPGLADVGRPGGVDGAVITTGPA